MYHVVYHGKKLIKKIIGKHSLDCRVLLTPSPRDHVEAALAHITPGVEGVYNKAGYLEQRRAMMQAWADHLDTIRDPQVIQFARPASA